MNQGLGLQVAGLVSLAAMAALVGIAALVVWRRPGAASALLARLPGSWTGHHVDRVQRFETDTYDLVRSGLRPLVAAETSFHALSFVESWFVRRFGLLNFPCRTGGMSSQTSIRLTPLGFIAERCPP